MDRTPSLSEIERLEGLARAATQGPWMRSGVRQKLGDEDCLRVGPDGFALAFLPIGARPREQAGAIADADYIVALHNAFPDLAQALRESMEREAGLLSRAGDLLEQIDTLEGVEFSRDFEPYEAEACWDDAVSRLRAALSAPGSEAVK